tara:strand:- start:49 stop:390 length:342 start_codon:yes stop_codon:yes gene_type:complete
MTKNFSKHHYRPLPKEVILKESKIHGFGVFANEDIPKGKDLGMTHIWTDYGWVRTPLGGFINHSEDPNSEGRMCDNVFFQGSQAFRTLFTLKDIKKHDELTFFYSLPEYELIK